MKRGKPRTSGVKLSPDTVGIALGLNTIPMTLLSMAGVVAGLMLGLWQDWRVIVLGLVAFLIASILARVLEQVVIAIDDSAAKARDQQRRRRAYAIATVSGALPVLVVFAVEIVSFRGVLTFRSSAPNLLCLLWGYFVATAPWSLYADQVSRFRRTLVGIRAYAGHVALWLFAFMTLWLHTSPAIIVAVLLVPACLPFTVGLLLALADRKAIANVRV